MVIDINKCIGCYNCFMSCRDEFAGNEYPGYSAPQPMTGMNWMRLIERERGQYPKVKVAYTPIPCMHCADGICMKVAQNKAVYKTKEGIVLIDPVKAKGQKQIVTACPYRVIEWNEVLQIPQKCTLCAHLLAQGEKETRCVESCPTGALVFGDLDNPQSEVAKLIAKGQTEALHPEYGLQEQVHYLNLAKKFIAGTVIYGDMDKVAVGLDIKLTGNGNTLKTKTNGFGDFEFEGLPDNLNYTIKVEAPDYTAKRVEVKTQKDIYVGEIVLKKISR
jgi:Fe-S-cluster-containing dehydrogenase component